jgi:hypothetical protein
MKQAIVWAIVILLGIHFPTGANPMTNNEKYLKDTQAHAKDFEVGLEPERLREAYMALENVILAQEPDTNARIQLRATVLSSWLYLLQILDRFLDPNFNPNDVPEKFVQPPPLMGGVLLRPGADPALIDDPVARAEYEKAIAANRVKAEKYRLQVHLHRLDEQIPQRAEAFICNSYTFAPSDRDEVKAQILKMIKNPLRQAVLLKACYEAD